MHPSSVRALERILGPAQGPTPSGFLKFSCPHCDDAVLRRFRFGVSVTTGKTNCKNCGHRGHVKEILGDGHVTSLFKAFRATPRPENANPFVSGKPRIPYAVVDSEASSHICKRVIKYLEERGVSSQRAEKLKIGYGIRPPWTGLVIHPWYLDDNKTLAGWQGRKTYNPEKGIPKTLTTSWDEPCIEKTLTPGGGALYLYEHLQEGEPFGINEGPYDSLSFGRVMPAVCLFGKEISRGQLLRIVAKKPSALYLGLDPNTYTPEYLPHLGTYAPHSVTAKNARILAKAIYPRPVFVLQYPEDFNGDLGGKEKTPKFPNGEPQRKETIEALVARAKRFKPGD